MKIKICKYFLIFFIIIPQSTFAIDIEEIAPLIDNGSFDLAIIELTFLSKKDSENTEVWRLLGYCYKETEQFSNAISAYEKVIDLNNHDYDAKLALSRLFASLFEYEKARVFLQEMLLSDSADVEAHLGLGRIYLYTDKLSLSEYHFRRAIKYLTHYVPSYFELAHVYIAHGKLDSAKNTYHKILEIDNSYSEAWHGIGKMYWWGNKPKTAISFYQYALKLDPTNTEILREFEDIKSSLQWIGSSKLIVANESEETYEINSFIQNYSIEKQFADWFKMYLNTSIDFSLKYDENEDLIIEKWFDNVQLKLDYFSIPNNQVSFFSGVSFNDNTLTSYGANVISTYTISAFTFKNYFTGAYDYFYYWNKVGRHYFNNFLIAKYEKIELSSSFQYGRVKENWIWDYYKTNQNPYIYYSADINYTLLDMPKIKIGFNQTGQDFKYYSPLYYTPVDRIENAISYSVFYNKNKFYIYFSGKNGIDNFDTSSKTINFDISYSMKSSSVSVGSSYYDNPYYKHFAAYLIAMIHF